MTQALLAILFALCGWYSSNLWTPQQEALKIMALPVPFAILCAFLVVRRVREVLILPLIVLTWLLAWLMALAGTMSGVAAQVGVFGPYLLMALAGLMGGVGMVLTTSFVYPSLMISRYAVMILLIAGVSALPFGFWLSLVSQQGMSGETFQERTILRCSFMLWQTAVGLCLYHLRRDSQTPVKLGCVDNSRRTIESD